MKKRILISIILIFFSLQIIIGCFLTDAAKDVDETLALKNVKPKYDTLIFTFNTPNLTGGDTVGELKDYGIGITLVNAVENTGSDSRDAKFGGMRNRLVFDTLQAESLTLITDPFEIPKDTVIKVSTEGTLNLETHKKAGKYIIQQAVDGNDVKGTLTPVLIFTVSNLSFEPEIVDIPIIVPTRASLDDATRTKLRALLNSGKLD